MKTQPDVIVNVSSLWHSIWPKSPGGGSARTLQKACRDASYSRANLPATIQSHAEMLNEVKDALRKESGWMSEPTSRLNTTSRLIVGEISVSEVLINARRDNVKKQSEIADVSDLLTINFIFDVNFLKRHLLIWRTVTAPETDWAVAEAAKI
ncbi:unnamed protein product [Mortierella alpina]